MRGKKRRKKNLQGKNIMDCPGRINAFKQILVKVRNNQMGFFMD